jgi:hypothetical protein
MAEKKRYRQRKRTGAALTMRKRRREHSFFFGFDMIFGKRRGKPSPLTIVRRQGKAKPKRRR